MNDSIASPPLPLQSIGLVSYAYQQYADDDDIQAFISAYNTLTQSYLSWFSNTPLALYTSPNISGPLLDWIGQGIYGISRPVFSTLATDYTGGAINAFPIDVVAINASTFSSSGSAILATDDYYKRTITWFTYIGNGRYTNATNIRLRVARFLYGVNGTDVTLSQAQNVSVTIGSGNDITITIPSGTASSYFQEAFQAGLLAFPFQLDPTVTII